MPPCSTLPNGLSVLTGSTGAHLGALCGMSRLPGERVGPGPSPFETARLLRWLVDGAIAGFVYVCLYVCGRVEG